MLIDCHNHLGADLLFYLHGDFPYSQQLLQMQHEGGALGITHWVAFPFVSYAAMDVTKFRSGGIGFDSVVPVVLSGDGGILDTRVDFDTALTVFLA